MKLINAFFIFMTLFVVFSLNCFAMEESRVCLKNNSEALLTAEFEIVDVPNRTRTFEVSGHLFPQESYCTKKAFDPNRGSWVVAKVSYFGFLNVVREVCSYSAIVSNSEIVVSGGTNPRDCKLEQL